MRAISCNAPGDLSLVEAPEPSLKPGWVLLETRYVGICGTDYHIYTGHHPYLNYPRILGHELSATVLDANGSTRLAAGDVVTVNPYLACHDCPACREGKTNCCETLSVIGVHSDGGMAERFAMPDGNLYRADGLSARDAAMVEFLAIGAHAVRRTDLARGHRVLVAGGGPIGLGAAFFAAIAGAEVTILDAAADKRDTARDLGFGAFTLDEIETEPFRAVRRSGFDAVFDATGNIGAMNKNLFHVRNGGAYTLVGVITGDLVWPDAEVHRRELTIRASRNATPEDFEHVMASIRAGKVPTDKLATHATTLNRVSDDLPVWSKARDGLIKAIVEVRP
jgi:2-desacetyl-2-hydroxyethyl bacteriochlorophyllide A dehydrogenase